MKYDTIVQSRKNHKVVTLENMAKRSVATGGTDLWRVWNIFLRDDVKDETCVQLSN